MSDQEYKAALNYVPIDKETNDWLVTEANKEGIQVRVFAGLLLDEKARQYFRAAYEKDEDQGVWDEHWYDQYSRMWARTRRAAAIYLDNPSDEARDRLERMCTRLGKDVDEIIAEADANPFSTLVAREKEATKRGECILWLCEVMRDHGGSVDASVIYAMADQKGYSTSTLNRAKRDINNDPNTPNIVPGRSGPRHLWVLEE